MVEQLRLKERIRETFGRYVDPRIVEGLISGPALAAEGQRRVMTVLFCDVKGFVGVSEEMTPQGLVKVMNRYFSVMSAPIHEHGGIIDKYIGDAIMAYWGPPFTADGDQARFAGLAALDMLARVAPFRAELPELLGLRNVPISFDIRIGIATGEALVGSIGSDVLMSYTVMGETVNLASRSGRRQQDLWQPYPDDGGDGHGGRRRARSARNRSRGAGRSKPCAAGLRNHGTQRRSDAQSDRAAQPAMPRALPPIAIAVGRRRGRLSTAALAAMPDDGPTLAMLKRIDTLAGAPPAENWDGAWHLDQK